MMAGHHISMGHDRATCPICQVIDGDRAAEEAGRGARGTMTKDVYRDGITIRDYLAARAMQGLVMMLERQESASVLPTEATRRLAVVSYSVADAMLKERDA